MRCQDSNVSNFIVSQVGMNKQQLLFLEDHFVTAKRSINEMERDRSKARSHAALVSHDARKRTRQSKLGCCSASEATPEDQVPRIEANVSACSNDLDRAPMKNSVNEDTEIEAPSLSPQNVCLLPEPCLSYSLGGCWGDAEDRHYLKQWLSITGPWHACYDNASHASSHEDHASDVSELPVTRHLLIAIALLDEPLSADDPSAVMIWKRKITHHYRSAVSALQSADSITFDTVAAAAIAWLFETVRADKAAADIHLQAYDRLEKDYLVSRSFTGKEAAAGILEGSVCRCFECRSSNQFSLREMEKHGLFHFTLRGPSCVAMKYDLTLPVVLAQIEDYFDRLEIHRDSGFENYSMIETAGLIRRWDLELLKLRHRHQHVPDLIFVARLLIMIVNSLLPRRSGDTFVLEPDAFAWNFCLFKVEQILHRTELQHLDRQHVTIVAIDILKAIVRFATDEKHFQKAVEILQSISGSS